MRGEISDATQDVPEGIMPVTGGVEHVPATPARASEGQVQVGAVVPNIRATHGPRVEDMVGEWPPTTEVVRILDDMPRSVDMKGEELASERTELHWEPFSRLR